MTKKRRHKLSSRAAVLVFLIITVTGILLYTVRAAVTAVHVEAEAGELTTGAARVFDDTASGSHSLKFGTLPGSGGEAETSITAFGAKCDGVNDDKAALEAGIADLAAKGGGTLTIPDATCVIVQPAGGSTVVGSNITIRGAGANSRLNLSLASPGAYERLFTINGTGSTLENLTLARSTPGPGIMIALDGEVSDFTMNRLVLDGQYNVNPQEIHGIYIADQGTYRNIKLLGSTFTNLHFALLMTNTSTSTVDGFTVDTSKFIHNYADDLEFNAPVGTMRNISVTNSEFRDNQWRDISATAGIGLGFANVQTGVIRGNTFDGYFVPPLHIEDRSSNITVDGNTLSNGGTIPLDYASYIFILNESHDITITNNTVDTSANTNPVYAVFSGPGGAGLPAPYNIKVSGNTFKLRPNAQQSLGDMELTDNTIITVP